MRCDFLSFSQAEAWKPSTKIDNGEHSVADASPSFVRAEGPPVPKNPPPVLRALVQLLEEPNREFRPLTVFVPRADPRCALCS